MKKLVIIINGRGGVGKDTLCDMVSKKVLTMNISSITPVKEIAMSCGWEGEKTDKSRKFLSDLKKVLIEYNDYPTKYLLKQYKKFLESDSQILFVQIREAMEIDKFKAYIEVPCISLLITRSSQDFTKWGNLSDDEVELYNYDYEFDNCISLEEVEYQFVNYILDLYKKLGE